METFDNLIPKAKTTIFEYQSCIEHLQRLRNRLNRLVQTNRTPEATKKLADLESLLKDLSNIRENVEQSIESSQKTHYQMNEFEKQCLFYKQWLDNIDRQLQNMDQLLTIEKIHRCNDIHVELEKRKQIIANLLHEYPHISHIKQS
ncbi:unnamed protein product, partial [Didymodactylos carnosus]